MERPPVVSYIIPIFNVAPFIAECAESLFKQTYEHIEFIFIDDNCTDNSIIILSNIITQYPHRDVKIIHHKENRGSAFSRADGIKIATGSYLAFCDGDDWVDNDMIESLVNIALQTQCDIISSACYVHTEKKYSVFKYKNRNFADLNNIPIDFLHFALWNKLFRTSLFIDNNLTDFININCWDDTVITTRAFALTDKTTLVNEAYYHYRFDNCHSSLSSQCHSARLKDHLKCAYFLCEWFKERNIDTQYATFLKFLKFTAKIKMLRGNQRDITLWKKTFPETNHGILCYKNIPIQYRFLFFLVNILPTGISQTISNCISK